MISYFKGFTLIEALVAVAILALAVGGPLYAANRALVVAAISRDQLIATSLAEEAIEYVRLQRDDDFLALGTDSGWSQFLFDVGGCVAPNKCTVDPPPINGVSKKATFTACTGTCTPLNLTGGGIYQQTGSPASIFTRSMSVKVISSTPGQQEEQVQAQVSWRYHGTVYTVTLFDELTQWQ